MGQKVRPFSFRLGVTQNWKSIWFAGNKNYARLLKQDIFIRSYLENRLKNFGVSSIKIERLAKKIVITIWTSRPGLVIGKKGVDIEEIRAYLAKSVSADISINISEIRKPEVNAKLIADNISSQLEKRGNFRKVVKKAIRLALRFGALGIRVNCSGRLNGADIARMEWYREGSVPLHTLRANIDYGMGEAHTTYGVVGVKVWVFRGEQYNTDANFLPHAKANGF